jgi:hypothetical protein
MLIITLLKCVSVLFTPLPEYELWGVLRHHHVLRTGVVDNFGGVSRIDLNKAAKLLN